MSTKTAYQLECQERDAKAFDMICLKFLSRNKGNKIYVDS